MGEGLGLSDMFKCCAGGFCETVAELLCTSGGGRYCTQVSRYRFRVIVVMVEEKVAL